MVGSGEEPEVVTYLFQDIFPDSCFALWRQRLQDPAVTSQNPVDVFDILFIFPFYAVIISIATVSITESFIQSANNGFITLRTPPSDFVVVRTRMLYKRWKTFQEINNHVEVERTELANE